MLKTKEKVSGTISVVDTTSQSRQREVKKTSPSQTSPRPVERMPPFFLPFPVFQIRQKTADADTCVPTMITQHTSLSQIQH